MGKLRINEGISNDRDGHPHLHLPPWRSNQSSNQYVSASTQLCIDPSFNILSRIRLETKPKEKLETLPNTTQIHQYIYVPSLYLMKIKCKASNQTNLFLEGL